ncbi:MAG TPA: hypothetical protein VK921_05205 [Anditalea sp.]|nr:hypothetical protein [Anditalea sp.]
MFNKPLYIYLILLILLAILVLGSFSYYSSNYSTISISPNRTLQWRDFKLVKVINNRPGINARCITTITPSIKNVKQEQGHAKVITAIEVGIDEDLTQVSGSFMTKADQNKKQIVLNHENGHFKIAQIIGYTILEQIDAYRFHPTNYRQEFDSLVRAQFQEWRKMDNQYDIETTNPRDLVKQREWDQYFKSALNK